VDVKFGRRGLAELLQLSLPDWWSLRQPQHLRTSKTKELGDFFVKKVVLTVTVLVLCSLSFAQNPNAARVNPQPEAAALLAQKSAAQATSHRPPSSADCVFTFTSGAKNTFLKYCVTATGNVTAFESPAGHEHIAVGADGEGTASVASLQALRTWTTPNVEIVRTGGRQPL
jgi:hypothetical protein